MYERTSNPKPLNPKPEPDVEGGGLRKLSLIVYLNLPNPTFFVGSYYKP